MKKKGVKRRRKTVEQDGENEDNDSDSTTGATPEEQRTDQPRALNATEGNGARREKESYETILLGRATVHPGSSNSTESNFNTADTSIRYV